MSKVRLQVRGEGHKVSPTRWQKSIDESFISLIKQRKLADARRYLFASLTGNGKAGK